MHRHILPIVISALAITTTPAAADETRSTRVHYGDLNLTEVGDADELVRRVQLAAREVCADNVGERDPRIVADIRTCVRDAMAQAIRDLDHPVVTARYAREETRVLASR